MSPNASTPRDKQSLGYIVRSGIAGGVAGCVVRTSGFQRRVSPMRLAHQDFALRPRRLLRRWTESRFSFKPRIQTSRSMPGVGVERFVPVRRFTRRAEVGLFSRAILQL